MHSIETHNFFFLFLGKKGKNRYFDMGRAKRLNKGVGKVRKCSKCLKVCGGVLKLNEYPLIHLPPVIKEKIRMDFHKDVKLCVPCRKLYTSCNRTHAAKCRSQRSKNLCFRNSRDNTPIWTSVGFVCNGQRKPKGVVNYLLESSSEKKKDREIKKWKTKAERYQGMLKELKKLMAKSKEIEEEREKVQLRLPRLKIWKARVLYMKNTRYISYSALRTSSELISSVKSLGLKRVFPCESNLKSYMKEFREKISHFFTLKSDEGSMCAGFTCAKKLMKYCFILNGLSLPLGEKFFKNDFSQGLAVFNWYYDGATITQRKGCVNDYVVLLNDCLYPSPFDLTVASHIESKDEENEFSGKLREEFLTLINYLNSNEGLFQGVEYNSCCMRSLKKVDELRRTAYLLRGATESSKLSPEDIKLFNGLEEQFLNQFLALMEEPLPSFGFKSLAINYVLDLKSLTTLLGHGCSAKYCCPDLGTISKEWCKELFDKEIRKHYFKLDGDGKVFFDLESNTQTPNSPFHSVKCSSNGVALIKCRECGNGGKLNDREDKPIILQGNRDLLLQVEKKHQKVMGFSVSIGDKSTAGFGTNSLHNICNIAAHLFTELLIYLSFLDRTEVVEQRKVKGTEYGVTRLMVRVEQFVRDETKIRSNDGASIEVMLFHRESLKKKRKKGVKNLFNTLPRLMGTDAKNLVNGIQGFLKNISSFLNGSENETDLEAFSILFLSVSKIRAELVRKQTYTIPDLEVLSTRINRLKKWQSLGIISSEYIGTRLSTNLFRSVSLREFLITCAYREGELMKKGLTSANLSDEVHEAYHRMLKLLATNNRESGEATASWQRVSNTIHLQVFQDAVNVARPKVKKIELQNAEEYMYCSKETFESVSSGNLFKKDTQPMIELLIRLNQEQLTKE